MVNVRRESFPIAGTFAINRGAKTQAEVVVAEVSDGTYRGCGEMRALCAVWEKPSLA